MAYDVLQQGQNSSFATDGLNGKNHICASSIRLRCKSISNCSFVSIRPCSFVDFPLRAMPFMTLFVAFRKFSKFNLISDTTLQNAE